eukprot:8965742-Pyramimonas_sp.AAC.1
MRRVRAGARGSAVGARQSAPRASGHARKRCRGAPECVACERARTGAPSRCAGERRVRAVPISGTDDPAAHPADPNT